MAYTFVRIRNKINVNGKGSWYLLADSIDTIKEHFNTYGKTYFKDGVNDYLRWCNTGRIGHFDHHFPYVVEITAQKPENYGLPWFIVAAKVENLMYQTQTNLFNNGAKFYLNKEMVSLVDNPTIKIIETRIKEKMVYPDDEEMSLEDVRYIQWDNGTHWYAKVGKFDVVDKDNNQKWDTKEEAREAAKWFINNF